MNSPESLPTALVISNDKEVVEAIVSNNTTEQKINARQSVQEVISSPDILESNSIIIFDIGTTNNDVEQAIDLAIKLKQSDPTQSLLIVGDKEPLNDILKSSIQPMVYRAFNKPISPNQIFLSFKSANAAHQELVERRAAGEDISIVGPSENRTNVDTLAEERKTNPLIYAAVGVVVVAIIAWLFLGGSGEEENSRVAETIQPLEVEPAESEPDIYDQLNELNQLASNALLEGRLIAPKGDNALEYYDKALEIDPYDSIAYEGRKAVATGLRDSYTKLLSEKEFDKALNVLSALTTIEPLNPANDKLQNSLESAVAKSAEEARAAGNAERLASATKAQAKLVTTISNAEKAQKAEKELVNKIKTALSQNNLVPPKSNNAYTLLSSGLKRNTVSKKNAQPLINSLSSKLVSRANASFAKGNLGETDQLVSLISKINVDNAGLASLKKRISDRKIALANEQKDASEAAKLAKQAEEEAKRKRNVVIPAKLVSRSAPRYPSSAQKKNIEGWVRVTFVINKKGVPTNIKVTESQPKGTFDESAIKSLKKWRFSPARNQETGQAVESSTISTKINFQLN